MAIFNHLVDIWFVGRIKLHFSNETLPRGWESNSSCWQSTEHSTLNWKNSTVYRKSRNSDLLITDVKFKRRIYLYFAINRMNYTLWSIKYKVIPILINLVLSILSIIEEKKMSGKASQPNPINTRNVMHNTVRSFNFHLLLNLKNYF